MKIVFFPLSGLLRPTQRKVAENQKKFIFESFVRLEEVEPYKKFFYAFVWLAVVKQER